MQLMQFNKDKELALRWQIVSSSSKFDSESSLSSVEPKAYLEKIEFDLYAFCSFVDAFENVFLVYVQDHLVEHHQSLSPMVKTSSDQFNSFEVFIFNNAWGSQI